MNKVTVEDAQKLFDQLVEWNKPKSMVDSEMMHTEEDNLMCAFIQSLASGEYEINEAIEVSKKIKEINDLPFARWYA